MTKLLRSFLLLAAITGLIVTGSSAVAPAQVKKDDKTKKDDKGKAEAVEVGTVEVYMAKDGWRFRIKNTEGKSIAIGTVGYDKKEDAMKVLETVKATLAKAKVTEIKDNKK